MRCAVCLYVRDEEHEIAEWLAYQHIIGFDTCIVYDNGSTDRTAQIVLEASLNQDVRFVEWPCLEPMAQVLCYEDCIKRFGAEFDWIAFFDVDEFLVLNSAIHLKEFLAAHDPVSAIAINWAFFGSNGHQERPSQLVIEAFTRRAPRDFEPNRQFKTVARPGPIKSFINMHLFKMDGLYSRPGGGGFTLHSPGAMIEDADYQYCQLNHYFTRSRQHWESKAKRGYRHGRVRTESEFAFYDRNDEEDLRAASVAPLVRRQMASYRPVPSFTIISERSGIREVARRLSALDALSLASSRRLEGADKVWVYGPDGAFIGASELARAAQQQQ